jgi:hypothetical protein
LSRESRRRTLDRIAMRKISDRPPIFRFLLMFTALLTVVLGLAAL